MATLIRQDDRGVGSAADFPPGSVAHAQPPGGPGFFLVRAASGTLFRAYADRSPHRGQPLEYRDPLPGTANHADGPQPGFYDPAAGANHTLDGESFSGPAPQPLDPFPVVTDGDRLEIGTHAVCPSDLAQLPAWCGAPDEGPRALPAGQAVILLLPHRWVDILSEPGLRAGVEPVRRLTEQELRAWGFEVAHTPSDLERLSAAGARVLWIHRAALGQVDPAWARARYAEGRAVGVLDGTVADLVDRLGLGENGVGWIQPGGTRPVFALAFMWSSSCPASSGRGQRSDWLSLSWLLAATRAALADPCTASPDAHDLAVTNDLDETVTLQVSPTYAPSATDAQRTRIGDVPAHTTANLRAVLPTREERYYLHERTGANSIEFRTACFTRASLELLDWHIEVPNTGSACPAA